MSVRIPNNYCIVDGCKSETGQRDGISFFRFPKDPERCRIWKTILGFTGSHKFANFTPEQSYGRLKICSLHFADESFANKTRNRIKQRAVPLPNAFSGYSSWVQSSKDAAVQTEVKLRHSQFVIHADSLQSQNQQHLSDPTPSFLNYGLEPKEKGASESSLKRKREDTFELIPSDSNESDAHPDTLRTTKNIVSVPVEAETYTSYKKKYNDLLVAYRKLELELSQLKNDRMKSSDTSYMAMPEWTQIDNVQKRHSQEEITELAKHWTDEFSQLREDQQSFAKEAIREVFNAAKMNQLHSESIKINDYCVNTIRRKMDETEIEVTDEHLSSKIEGPSCASVKAENNGKTVYNVPSTSFQSDMPVSIKTEETAAHYDSIYIKSEADDIFDEENEDCNYYEHVHLMPDSADVKVKSENLEPSDYNDMSHNKCLRESEDNYRVSNLISTVCDDNEGGLNIDSVKVETD